jgi:hypothetical protein
MCVDVMTDAVDVFCNCSPVCWALLFLHSVAWLPVEKHCFPFRCMR